MWRPFSQARSLSRSPWDTAFPPLSLLPNFPRRTRKAPGEAPRSWQQALGWPCSGAKDEVLPPLPSREGTVPPPGWLSAGGVGEHRAPRRAPARQALRSPLVALPLSLRLFPTLIHLALNLSA